MWRLFGFLFSFMFIMTFIMGWMDTGTLIGGIVLTGQIVLMFFGLLAVAGVCSVVWFGKWWKK